MPVELGPLAAFASSAVSYLGERLADSALQEYRNSRDVEWNLNSLANGVNTVISNLEWVDDRHLALAHSTFRSWVQELNKLCYDVDDIMDDINLRVMKLDHQRRSIISSELNNGVRSQSFYSRLFGWPRTSIWRSNQPANSIQSASRYGAANIIMSSLKKWNLSRKISDLQNHLNAIERQVTDAVSLSNAKARGTRRTKANPGLTSDLHLPTERLSEKQKIIDKLLQMQGGGISIVGMAGLGKSVLALSILNDDIIKQEFHVIQWVSASNHNWNSDEDIQTETIPSLRQQSLAGSSTRKSLLLVDDLRITRIRDWRVLRAALVKKLEYNPTVVLVTSRDPAVAKYTETTLLRLPALSIENCEEIIKNTLFPVLSNHYCNSVIRTKGKCIAHKCEGLPMVAHLIGVYLRCECNVEGRGFDNAISSLEEQELWEHEVFKPEILPELGFDDVSLPKRLYKFLAYFALFPSEYPFDDKDLSLLWMAEGFNTSTTEGILNPDVDIIKALLATSMLKRTEPSSSSAAAAASTYQMHNFAHKYAQVIADNTYFWLDEARLSSFEKGDIPSNFTSYIRHFSSYCKTLEENILKFIKEKHHRLRTFLLSSIQHQTNIRDLPPSLLKKLEYLRVLSLQGSNIKRLPHTMGNLKHLRYLDVSRTDINKLPIGLCNLFSLQVLKLKSCPYLMCLPDNFENLTNLIHLELDMLKLASTPANLGRLTKLQNLPVFIVEKWRGHHVSELKNMNSLRESIRILKLEEVANENEAKEAMLCKKANIDKLGLEWTANSNQDPSTVAKILTSLEPSDKLKELRVSNYNGIKFPNWVIDVLKDVRIIYLYNCPKCRDFPSFGLLPLLKKLEIEGMPEIETVKPSRYKRAGQHGEFPTLEYLKISDMKKLEKWETIVTQDMLQLRELKVSNCPKLVSMSMIRNHSLEELNIEVCPNLILDITNPRMIIDV